MARLRPEELRRCWAELHVWVSWFVDRYHLADEVPPCWPRHPALVDELSALWHYHQEVTRPFVAMVQPDPVGSPAEPDDPKVPARAYWEWHEARWRWAQGALRAASGYHECLTGHRHVEEPDRPGGAAAFTEAASIELQRMLDPRRRFRSRSEQRHASSAWWPASHDRSALAARSASSCSPSATPPARGSTATGSSSPPSTPPTSPSSRPVPPSTSRATSPATASAAGSASSPTGPGRSRRRRPRPRRARHRHPRLPREHQRAGHARRVAIGTARERLIWVRPTTVRPRSGLSPQNTGPGSA